MGYRGAVGEEIFVRCPSCGSLDTYQHYDPDCAGCNSCGAVFIVNRRGKKKREEEETDESE